jgi:hypothetical protein
MSHQRSSQRPWLAYAGAFAAGAAALCQAPLAHAQSVAYAQEPDKDWSAVSQERYESPQYAALELRFGPYNPNIDENTTTPVYSDFFGDGQRYFFGLEVDYQAWRAPYIGTLGVGVGWGYTQMSATNLIPEGEDPSQNANVAQESSLHIMPFYAVGVLRVDTFSRNLSIPLVPYAKFGLAYALWWVTDGIDTATNDAGIKGQDDSLGLQGAVGAMFLLDILEPTAARGADADTGVNNSYLFFEWSVSDYGGNQMNVGSSNWVTGLAFEM